VVQMAQCRRHLAEDMTQDSQAAEWVDMLHQSGSVDRPLEQDSSQVQRLEGILEPRCWVDSPFQVPVDKLLQEDWLVDSQVQGPGQVDSLPAGWYDIQVDILRAEMVNTGSANTATTTYQTTPK